MKQNAYIMFLFYMLLILIANFSIISNKFVFNFKDKENIKNAKAAHKIDKKYQINDFLANYSLDESNSCEIYKQNNNIDITFLYNNKTLKTQTFEGEGITKLQQSIIKSSFKNRVNVMKFAYINGFSKEESVLYSFPELKKVINKIEKEVYISPKDNKLMCEKNTTNVYIEKAKNGVKMNKITLFDSIYNNFCKFLDNFTIEVQLETINHNNNEVEDNLRGEYKTSFKTSNAFRKNNIKRALESIDGVVLMPEESFSFNKTTGLRSETNGYMKAKIIKDGTFYEEFGGGVCQVSTTLYNAALYAGLEITEVHPHSLPVGYVEPCFDAMVNSGSSDLIIKNNTAKPIIIATSYNNDMCIVRIYGEKNPYNIIRKSEKTQEIPNFERVETTDYKKYGLTQPLNKEETKIISYGKPGYKAVGVLEYYLNDVLIKTKKIREHTYKPTKQVVLVGEQNERLTSEVSLFSFSNKYL